MAQKKNSKKDLEKRVAKLKKKVATLTSSLTKKQSELASTLSAVQKKLDKLRKRQSPVKDLTSQGERQQELAQTIESLAARVHDLEQAVSMVERAGEEVLERTRGLETRVAEATVQGDRLALLPGEQDFGQQHGLDVLRERTQVLEDHLGRLHAAQEGLELQIALLSREAEDAGDIPQAEKHAVVTDARPSDSASYLAQQIPRLQTQFSHAEEATGKLARRAAVLEAGQESLAEQDAQLSSQLQELQRKISELSDKAEQSGVGQLLPALEQQVALLNTDRSLNHSRIEEVLNKADELEKTKLNYTRHTDALADRVSTLSEQLQGLLALDPERRFEELDRRGGALEQSLRDERERLDAVQQSEQTLDQRLLSTIDDAAALTHRISTLGAGGEQLGSEIERLEDELNKVNEIAQQHRERLQAHELGLEEQRQRLDDADESRRKTSDGVNARFATLDDSRQTLQEATDALRVQQVRQEHDTQSLQQSLKRRTLLGLLLLLAVGVLGYLFLRGPTLPEGLHTAMRAGKAANDQAIAAIADLESDMGALRQEVLALGKSLAQVAQSVDELNSGAATEMPAQLNGLAEMIESLNRRDLEQVQESQAFGRELDQQRQESLLLKEGQEQIKRELDKLSDTSETPSEKQTQVPAVAKLEASAVQKSVWSKAQESGRYTLQLAGFHEPKSLEWFLKWQDFGPESAVYNTEYQGKPWFVVFHGIFPTVEQALAAARQLPPELASLGPWVRRIPMTGDIRPH